MNDISIRLFNNNDKDQIISIFEIFGNYFVEIDPLKRCIKKPNYGQFFLNKLIKDTTEKDGAIYVAEKENEVIGFVGGGCEVQPEDEQMEVVPTKWGKIYELFVLDQYRGTGLGSRLIKTMEDYFRSKGRDYVKLEVFEPNKLAHHFYKTQHYADRVISMMKKL